MIIQRNYQKRKYKNNQVLFHTHRNLRNCSTFFIWFFNRETNQSTEAIAALMPNEELSLEEQMNRSIPVIVEAPNYNATNSNSSLIPPKIKKVSQKYVECTTEPDEWISKNAIETYSPLLNAAPSFYNYEESLNALGKLPVPRVIDGQYLRFWEQDENYNYFAYGAKSYVDPGAVRLFILNKENTNVLYDYKFKNYIFPPKIVASDRDSVYYNVGNFSLQNDVLYFSFYHNWPAFFSHWMNGYISAFDTSTNKIRWISKPLVCNANFIIDGDFIITGYGFFDEPDFLYILDKTNGCIVSKTTLAYAPDIIGIKGNHIFVRTDSHEYEFTLTRQPVKLLRKSNQ